MALRLSAGDPAPVAARERILIWCCVLAITALAWAYLLYLDHEMARAMEHGAMPGQMEMSGMPMVKPWTAADAFFTFVIWVIMMAAMMAGSTIPVMPLFAGAHAGRSKGDARLMILVFGLGYAVVWIGFSALATLSQWALHDTAMLSPSMAATSVMVGGAILCVAGVNQLIPFKNTCLMHCSSPLAFLMTHWRDGRLGALQMGMRHGTYCLGCCWALMTVLFVVGVMNLVRVAALALIVVWEKAGPAGIVVSRITGTVLIATGIFLLIGAQ